MALLVMGSPAEAWPQAAETLDGVEELVRAGRSEEARQELLRWWNREYGDASRRDVQRGLWLRAQLTVDPRQASLDYRRLVVEYPGGPYADLALLRLAQSAFALGDSAAAREHVTRLQRDYPAGSATREAEACPAGGLFRAGRSRVRASGGDGSRLLRPDRADRK
jgi:hypothetical protein